MLLPQLTNPDTPQRGLGPLRNEVPERPKPHGRAADYGAIVRSDFINSVCYCDDDGLCFRDGQPVAHC